MEECAAAVLRAWPIIVSGGPDGCYSCGGRGCWPLGCNKYRVTTRDLLKHCSHGPNRWLWQLWSEHGRSLIRDPKSGGWTAQPVACPVRWSAYRAAGREMPTTATEAIVRALAVAADKALAAEEK